MQFEQKVAEDAKESLRDGVGSFFRSAGLRTNVVESNADVLKKTPAPFASFATFCSNYFCV